MQQAGSSKGGNELSEDELKKMLHTFRVHELQLLMNFASQPRHGKKTELLNRALHLIKNQKALNIQMKIRDLYKKRYHEEFPGGTNDDLLNSEIFRSADFIPVAPYVNSAPVNLSTGGANNSVMNYNHIPSDPGYSNSNSGGIPLNPDIKLVKLPYYDHLATLIRPTALIPRSAQRFQEQILTFTLTPSQVMDLSYEENTSLPRPEIQMRFCFLDTTVEQKDDFPPSISVRMNDKMVALPNPIPTNKPGVEPKRPSRPVNITPYLRFTATQPQRIGVQWAVEANKNWTVSVYYVRHVTSLILLQRFKDKGIRNAEHTKALIKDKLGRDDSEIATTSLRVSLLCPLGKMRINIPCKVRTCDHMQCFDAYLYLAMNEKRPTWACPVCDKPAAYDELITDGYFVDVLAQTDCEISEIQVHDTGEWTPLIRDDDNNAIPAPTKKKLNVGGSQIKEISLDDSFSGGLESKASTSTKGQDKALEKEKAKPDEVVIDLTEDSDDDAPLIPTLSQKGSKTAIQRPLSNRSATSESSVSLNTPVATPAPPTPIGVGGVSPALIDLDSPPSRSNATPEDPVAPDSFNRPSAIISGPAVNSTTAPSTKAPTTCFAAAVQEQINRSRLYSDNSFPGPPAAKRMATSSSFDANTPISPPGTNLLPHSPRSGHGMASGLTFNFNSTASAAGVTSSSSSTGRTVLNYSRSAASAVSHPSPMISTPQALTSNFPPMPALKVSSGHESYPSSSIFGNNTVLQHPSQVHAGALGMALRPFYSGNASNSGNPNVMLQNSSSGYCIPLLAGSSGQPPPLRYGPTHSVVCHSSSQQQQLEQAKYQAAMRDVMVSMSWLQGAGGVGSQPTPSLFPNAAGNFNTSAGIDNFSVDDGAFGNSEMELQNFLKACINGDSPPVSKKN